MKTLNKNFLNLSRGRVFSSHVLLLCSVAVAALLLSLSLVFSLSSSLAIVGSGCWRFVVVASCSSVLGGSLERERERERRER